MQNQIGFLQPIATSGLPSFYGPSNVSANSLKPLPDKLAVSRFPQTSLGALSCGIFVFFFTQKKFFFPSLSSNFKELSRNTEVCVPTETRIFSLGLSLHLERDWHLHWEGDLCVHRQLPLLFRNSALSSVQTSDPRLEPAASTFSA